MVTQSPTRRLSATLSALAALSVALFVLGREPAAAQTALRWGRNDPGNVLPITVSADAITTWLDNGQRVLLLRGSVFIEQGVIQVRTQQAVVWVDEERRRKTGISYLDVYAEGAVRVVDGARAVSGDQAAERALLQLATRGTVRADAYGHKIAAAGRPLTTDPLYRAALAERSGSGPAPRAGLAPKGPPPASKPPSPGPSPIQRVSAQEVVPAPGLRPVQNAPQPVPLPPAAAQEPGPTPPVPPVPPNVGMPPLPQASPPGTIPEVPPAPRPLPPGEEPDEGPPRSVVIRPRSSLEMKIFKDTLPNGETVVVINTGAIITVTDPLNKGLIDIEADRIVYWTRGDFRQMFQGGGPPAGAGSRPHEFYLSGNVEIRQQAEKESRLIRADEVYYDVNRNVAIARDADLEVKQRGLPDPLHLQSPDLRQLNAKLFETGKTSVNASKLPYDPGLKVTTSRSTLEEIEIPKRGLFGLGAQRVDPKTGQPEVEKQRLFRGRNVVLWLEGLPVLWLPYVQGDANDPLGPLENLAFNYNRIFGFQTYVTLDVYDLLGLTPTAGTRWRLNLDYLSDRGPALGTDYLYTGRDLFGIPSKYDGRFRAWGLRDVGTDILGGGRGENVLLDNPLRWQPITHPEYRGRLLSQINVQEMPYGFSFQGQFAPISDRNFMEQYFNFEWNNELNQETFAYVKQQNGNWAWTVLGEVNIRNWITETEWLPRADGYLLGQKFFDLFTYNVHGSAGYAHLKPTHQPPPAYLATDQDTETGRFDLNQELSLPFTLGAFRLVPYGALDLTYYTEDLTGEERARILAGGGLRGSLPMSRLYPNIQSELFNLSGIFHKIVLSGNYYYARSDTNYTRLPQLDRLNDDTSDQALRDIFVQQPFLNPGYGKLLMTSPAFDPQRYAIRRLVENRIDTRDDIEVLQMGLRQRWQTKRGYPGQQHVIDWMTLDLSASYFPSRVRDNFGESFSFLEYDWRWHLGDRLTLLSDGWFEPLDQGARVWTVGAEINRPDNSLLYLGYRQIDPLRSRTVMAILSYAFSSKYSISAGAGFDFGNNIQINNLVLTRTGSDLQVSVGINYNSIVQTFGFTFEIFPNLLPANKRIPGSSGMFLSEANQR